MRVQQGAFLDRRNSWSRLFYLPPALARAFLIRIMRSSQSITLILFAACFRDLHNWSSASNPG